MAAKQTTKTTARIRRDLGVCCESIVIIWNVFMLVSLILPFFLSVIQCYYSRNPVQFQ